MYDKKLIANLNKKKLKFRLFAPKLRQKEKVKNQIRKCQILSEALSLLDFGVILADLRSTILNQYIHIKVETLCDSA